LHKDPAARFDRASALAQALAQTWPAASVPAQTPPTPDIHSQATSIWTNAPSVRRAPAQPAAPVPQTTPGAAGPAPSTRGRLRLPLPLLGLLALLLLGRAVLAARGGRATAVAPTFSPAPAASAVSATVASGATVAAPTTVPAPPSPTALAATGDPLVELRSLI